jgi:hypothetical protein
LTQTEQTFYIDRVTTAAAFTSTARGTARRPAYLPHPATAPQTLPSSLEDDWSGGSSIRFVLPRDKRDRLAQRAAQLDWRRSCSVAECGAESLPVLLVDSELEALLCPVHQLVLLDGSAVAGEPMLATAAW